LEKCSYRGIAFNRNEKFIASDLQKYFHRIESLSYPLADEVDVSVKRFTNKALVLKEIGNNSIKG